MAWVVSRSDGARSRSCLERERELLNRRVNGLIDDTAWLWRSTDALCVSRSDTRLPNFSQASGIMRSQGYTVVCRSTGGTAVLHEEGIVNLTLVYALQPHEKFSIEQSYRFLCGLGIGFLRHLGLKAGVAAVPGAFCDGNYNIVVDGRKIAGTAQRYVKRGSQHVVLSHFSLLVDVDVSAYAKRINAFYANAGSAVVVRPDAITCVSELLLHSESNVDVFMRRFHRWLTMELGHTARAELPAAQPA